MVQCHFTSSLCAAMGVYSVDYGSGADNETDGFHCERADLERAGEIRHRVTRASLRIFLSFLLVFFYWEPVDRSTKNQWVFEPTNKKKLEQGKSFFRASRASGFSLRGALDTWRFDAVKATNSLTSSLSLSLSLSFRVAFLFLSVPYCCCCCCRCCCCCCCCCCCGHQLLMWRSWTGLLLAGNGFPRTPPTHRSNPSPQAPLPPHAHPHTHTPTHTYTQRRRLLLVPRRRRRV